MDESVAVSVLKLRPVLVYRSKVARPSLREALESPSVQKQLANIRQWAAESRNGLETPVVLVRTSAHYRPQHHQSLVSAITHAQAHFELLAVDDLRRLIDCRDLKAALTDLDTLKQMKAPIFSVLHGQLLHKMAPAFLRAQIGDGVRAFERRSSSVKAGIERLRVPGEAPSKTASETGVRMKKQYADERAARLLPRIEATRSSLPLELQSSLSAIAKALNEAEVPTPSGRGRWQGVTVKRVLDRAGSPPPT